jgi:hypothetical protein
LLVANDIHQPAVPNQNGLLLSLFSPMSLVNVLPLTLDIFLSRCSYQTTSIKQESFTCHSIQAEMMIHYCCHFASNAPPWFIVASLQPL